MRKVLTILALIFCEFSFGQPNSFVKFSGPPQLISYGHGVHQSLSGSIYLAGYGDDVSTLYSLISFTKFDEFGSEIDTKYYGDSLHHFMLMRMLAINDNSFLLVGSKMIHGGNNNPYALLIDSTGSVIWENSSTSTFNSWFTGVSKFPNGNLVFSGAATDTLNGDLNLFGVITDSLGSTLHSFSFGDVGFNETSENCLVTNEGTIVVCGDKLINTSIVNPYVVAFDSTGNYLWDMTIGSHLNSGSKNLFIDRSNNVIVIGESATTSSPQFDIQISKIDVASASVVWMKLLQGTDMSDAGFALSETVDGHYVVAGYGHDSIYSTKRVVMIVTDTSGNELSKQYFGSSPINIGYEICPSIYGGFLIAGADFVNNQEILIYQKELGIGIEEVNEFSTSVYPNPISVNSKINFSDPIDQFTLLSISGQLIFSKRFDYPISSFMLPFITSGVYFLELEQRGKRFQSILTVTE
ncbi:MAG TPA: T9SS type A sorting domain-containing protein [Bacteroidia bacterium]|nr:T9SS type A sorting domain-containing protein [Bacteroidota bacterium]MBP9789950.1 T9SS type A sorting domain-containing protein [Bacteroidia bacterium]HQV99095.1 T9SS type A sorting domain-containing protein [Bacteroidia bacterium]HQW21902.1 T9SS type A sorting domain-containing protein [Bacteroidia bacterium]